MDTKSTICLRRDALLDVLGHDGATGQMVHEAILEIAEGQVKAKHFGCVTLDCCRGHFRNICPGQEPAYSMEVAPLGGTAPIICEAAREVVAAKFYLDQGVLPQDLEAQLRAGKIIPLVIGGRDVIARKPYFYKPPVDIIAVADSRACKNVSDEPAFQSLPYVVYAVPAQGFVGTEEQLNSENLFADLSETYVAVCPADKLKILKQNNGHEVLPDVLERLFVGSDMVRYLTKDVLSKYAGKSSEEILEGTPFTPPVEILFDYWRGDHAERILQTIFYEGPEFRTTVGACLLRDANGVIVGATWGLVQSEHMLGRLRRIFRCGVGDIFRDAIDIAFCGELTQMLSLLSDQQVRIPDRRIFNKPVSENLPVPVVYSAEWAMHNCSSGIVPLKAAPYIYVTMTVIQDGKIKAITRKKDSVIGEDSMVTSFPETTLFFNGQPVSFLGGKFRYTLVPRKEFTVGQFVREGWVHPHVEHVFVKEV